MAVHRNFRRKFGGNTGRKEGTYFGFLEFQPYTLQWWECCMVWRPSKPRSIVKLTSTANFKIEYSISDQCDCKRGSRLQKIPRKANAKLSSETNEDKKIFWTLLHGTFSSEQKRFRESLVRFHSRDGCTLVETRPSSENTFEKSSRHLIPVCGFLNKALIEKKNKSLHLNPCTKKSWRLFFFRCSGTIGCSCSH